MAANGGEFGGRALKIGLTTVFGALGGAALLRNTNWGPVARAFAAGGTGIAAGWLVGRKFPNAGIGVITAGLVVGGGFTMNAVAQSGLLTPKSASSTTGATGQTTGTTTSTTSTSTSTGLGLGSGAPRGVGQIGPGRANFAKVPAMLGPHLMAGKRLR